jgi:hypothetical protein
LVEAALVAAFSYLSNMIAGLSCATPAPCRSAILHHFIYHVQVTEFWR